MALFIFLGRIILLYIMFSFNTFLEAMSQTINFEGDVWAPYVMDSKKGDKGFMVEIAEVVFERAGYKVNFKVVPWTRSLIDVENGTTDGAMGIYYIQASEKGFILPIEEIGISINKLYVKNDCKWTYSGKNSLDTMVLGCIADYNYGELNEYIYNKQNNKSNNIEILSGNEAIEKNLKKLLSGRISVIIEDEIVVRYYVQKLGIQGQIREAGMVMPPNRVCIAFSAHNPRSKEYARILSEGIIILRKSGELKTILDKYNVKDWK